MADLFALSVSVSQCFSVSLSLSLPVCVCVSLSLSLSLSSVRYWLGRSTLQLDVKVTRCGHQNRTSAQTDERKRKIAKNATPGSYWIWLIISEERKTLDKTRQKTETEQNEIHTHARTHTHTHTHTDFDSWQYKGHNSRWRNKGLVVELLLKMAPTSKINWTAWFLKTKRCRFWFWSCISPLEICKQ